MVRRRRFLVLAALAAITALCGSGNVFAQGTTDLARLTLEDLMRVGVTSAGRKEQRALDTPAAVHVITRDDIRASGLVTLPELLRLVPGVQVARINRSAWAISVRGFNALLSDKVLVMLDGRTIYNPLFGGVFWDAEDLLVDDIDRIEVIRSPGGTVWGANSTNGVINVITRTAANTQGTLVSAGAGIGGSADSSVRHGWTAGPAAYRVFAKASAESESADAHDPSRRVSIGGRADWVTDRRSTTIDAGATYGRRFGMWRDMTQPTPSAVYDLPSYSTALHAQTESTWTLDGGSSIRLQSFADHLFRDETIGHYSRTTLDLEAGYHRGVGRHDIVTGAGVRHIDEQFVGETGWALSPSQQSVWLSNTFLQDDIGLTAQRRAIATVGAKLENDSIAGASVQPTARLMWHIVPESQRVWAAVSRGVRTPSALDRRFRVTYPYGLTADGVPLFAGAVGNPGYRDESAVVAEAGYRLSVASTASFDVTVFRSRYTGLRTNEPLAPVFEPAPFPHIVALVEFDNLLDAVTSGIEASAQWQVRRTWRLEGTYTGLQVTPHPRSESRDPTASTSAGSAPSYQWRVHSAHTLSARWLADVAVSRMGSVQIPAVEAYTRTDARLEWSVAPGLAIDLIGQNLTDDHHVEFNATNTAIVAAAQPRSLTVQLRWSRR